MISGTPHSRRALRMYVKMTGPLMVRGGHTRRVDRVGGFVSCDPVFVVGDKVEMELMLNPRSSAGVKVRCEVVSVQSDTDYEVGIELRWITAMTSRSPAALQRFLNTVLGVQDPSVVENDGGSFRYQYTFPDVNVVRVGSVFEAMKSRPMGQATRRSVLQTDPNLGPAKRTDIIGGDPDEVEEPPAVEVAPAPPSDDGLNKTTDTIPELVHDGMEEDVVEDDLAFEHMRPRSRPISINPSQGGSTEERRARARISASVPVSFFVHSRGTVGRAHNVSRSGLYIETADAAPKVGSRVNVRFPVRGGGGNHVVLLTCEVIRHRAPREKPGSKHGFAVCYLVVDELGRTGVFSHFINQHL